MRWIGKHQPIYIKKGDSWYNENNNQTYTATDQGWELEMLSCYTETTILKIPYDKRVKYGRNDETTPTMGERN